MSKSSEKLANARKEEIINACATLYETMGFRDITIRDIGAQTSFARTSIYNYFQTKEEIFLALLQREYERWILELDAILQTHASLSASEFAKEIAHTLENRACMLKLLSMNLYDIEGNSRLENLVAFKAVYAGALQSITHCLEAFFPCMSHADIQDFLYAFFPFLFGIYPYTTATRKQIEAMDLAHVAYPSYSIYEITATFVEKWLHPFTECRKGCK